MAKIVDVDTFVCAPKYTSCVRLINVKQTKTLLTSAVLHFNQLTSPLKALIWGKVKWLCESGIPHTHTHKSQGENIKAGPAAALNVMYAQTTQK